MGLFGYPYNSDLVICKDNPDYLAVIVIFGVEIKVKQF